MKIEDRAKEIPSRPRLLQRGTLPNFATRIQQLPRQNIPAIKGLSRANQNSYRRLEQFSGGGQKLLSAIPSQELSIQKPRARYDFYADGQRKRPVRLLYFPRARPPSAISRSFLIARFGQRAYVALQLRRFHECDGIHRERPPNLDSRITRKCSPNLLLGAKPAPSQKIYHTRDEQLYPQQFVSLAAPNLRQNNARERFCFRTYRRRRSSKKFRRIFAVYDKLLKRRSRLRGPQALPATYSNRTRER